MGLLVEGNRGWAQDAAALVLLVSKTTFDHNGQPSRTHSFDAGAAWENLVRRIDRGDLKQHTDFRRVYATLLDRWLGCDSRRVLGDKFEHVELL